MRSRLLATLGVIALLLSGCAAASAPVATLAGVDRTLVARLMAQGLNEPEALILAGTRFTVVASDDQSAHLTAALPTGGTVDLRISVKPAVAGDPSTPEVTSASTGAGRTVTIGYRVSGTAGVTAPGLVARAGAGSQLAMARTTSAPPTILASDTKPDLEVGVQATVTETSKAVFDEFVEKMQTYLKAEGTLDQFVEGLKAVGSVFEALDLRSDYQKLTKQIDALEACAKNPTNSLTIKAYKQDPTVRDRILQQVDATRAEIKANVAAQFLGVMDSLGSDLTGSKLLGIITGVGTSLTKNTLDGLNTQLIADLAASIVKCKEETPAPSPEETDTATAGATSPRATPVTPTQGPTQPGAPPTRVEGTISWDTTDATYSTAGSINFIGKAFMDIGDYEVQPGSTFRYAYSDDCGSTSKSGNLSRMTTGPSKEGVGRVNLVGGAGAPVELFLDLPDVFTCGDPPLPHHFLALPQCARILGAFTAGQPATYAFSCELRDGASGSVHGTLTTSP